MPKHGGVMKKVFTAILRDPVKFAIGFCAVHGAVTVAQLIQLTRRREKNKKNFEALMQRIREIEKRSSNVENDDKLKSSSLREVEIPLRFDESHDTTSH